MKHKPITYIKEYTLLTLSALLYTISIYCFVYANNFTNGGVAGIVAMINYLIQTDKYAGIINLGINIPLIILSFVGLSKEFAVKTTVHIVLVSIFLSVFAAIPIDQYVVWTPVNGEEVEVYYDIGKAILASLYGGVIAGASLALVLSIRGSSGGADIIGAFIQHKNPSFSVQWAIFAVNSAIIALSVIVYSFNVAEGKFHFGIDSLQPVMLAMIFQFVATKVCDVMMQGGKTALKFEVVTEYPEEVSKDLIENLQHGVTMVPATGMFAKKQKGLLICLVKKNQIKDFKDILKKYPDTFAYVGSVSEVIGTFNIAKASKGKK